MKKLLVVMMAITALLCLTFAACGGKGGEKEETPATYTVTISVSDAAYGTVSKTSIENVAKDTAISVNGNVLTVGEETVTATATANTAQYTYAFTGFTGTAATVTGNIEITANFSRTVNKYTITFEMGDGTAIDPMQVDYGTSVSELNTISVTAPTGYRFVKWQLKDGNNYVDFAGDEILEENITVKAVYEMDVYTVSIATNNAEYGTVSETSVANVPYGTAITVNENVITVGTTEIMATIVGVDDAQYTYAFTGFTGTVATVTGNIEITANFTREVKTYTVSIAVDNAEYGTVSESSIVVPYGTAITVDDATLTVGETEITATATIATEQYNYVFTGFTGTVDTVTGNVEITANFTRETKQNAVTSETNYGGDGYDLNEGKWW